MGLTKALALVAILVTACTPHRPEVPKKDLVEAAFQRWYKATCSFPRYAAIEFVKAPMKCGLLPDNDYWGCYTRGESLIQISSAVPPDMILQVLVHEMGHSMTPFRDGEHVEPHQGIMTGAISQSLPLITSADIDYVCRDYDCPCRNPEPN